MKKILFSIFAIALLSASASSARTLNIPKGLVDKLDSDGKCAIVEGIGEIQFLYSNGFAIGRDDSGKLMRFMPNTSPKKFPFSGLVISKSGKKLTTVKSCDASAVIVPVQQQVKRAVVQKPVYKQPVSVTVPKIEPLEKVPALIPISISRSKTKTSSGPLSISSSTIGGSSIAGQGQDVSRRGGGLEVRDLNSWTDVVNITHWNAKSMGGGYQNHTDSGFNVSVHVRPLRIGNTDAGVYFDLVDGVSKMHEPRANLSGRWDYDIVGGGISTYTHLSENSGFEVNTGIFTQKTNGSMTNGYWSKQRENLFDLRLRYDNKQRRENDEAWWTYYEFGGRYIHPFNVDYSDSEGRGSEYAYDNRWLNLFYNTDIYDYYIDDEGKWRLSPTLNVNSGYLWGKDSAYFQGGLGFKLAYSGYELLDIKLFNPRILFDGPDMMYSVIGTWKVADTFRVIWAAQTKEYTGQ